MLVLNRPMYCYDADKILGDIVVKKYNGEKLLSLNNNEYVLDNESILISDPSNNVLGLGGIIGGENSSTSLETKNIVLECAIFNPITIAKTSRELNINTDAKYRFERGVDEEIGKLAIIMLHII